jgi:hypothetical protein
MKMPLSLPQRPPSARDRGMSDEMKARRSNERLVALLRRHHPEQENELNANHRD